MQPRHTLVPNKAAENTLRSFTKIGALLLEFTQHQRGHGNGEERISYI